MDLKINNDEGILKSLIFYNKGFISLSIKEYKINNILIEAFLST